MLVSDPTVASHEQQAELNMSMRLQERHQLDNTPAWKPMYAILNLPTPIYAILHFPSMSRRCCFSGVWGVCVLLRHLNFEGPCRCFCGGFCGHFVPAQPVCVVLR